MQNMIDCARTLIAHRVNRIPLVDRDGKSEMVIGLISQYRVLKFIAANVRHAFTSTHLV
jgi:5'-AMP-activated protein kinase regulatory gamma subunit